MPALITTGEVWVAMRTDGYAGRGSIDDPYDGSTPGVFDSVMDSIEANTLIHLGPGKFQTRGFCEQGGTVWSVKSRQRIVGAGIDVTTLKLVDASVSERKYYVMGSVATVNDFEVSHLTFDCNLDGQTAANISAAAVYVVGSWSHIHHVRAIHFGTTDGRLITELPPRASLLECFIFYVARLNGAKGCVVEDCIIEEPALNTTYTTTCIILGCEGTGALHEDCVIRNNFVDCDYRDHPVRIASLTRSGTTATVTTALPHQRSNGQGVVISGAIDVGAMSSVLNGSFTIGQVINSTQFTVPVLDQGTTAASGEMWVGKYSSQRAQITAVSTTQSEPYVATITTLKPHNRLVGQKVYVSDVALSPDTDPNPYNGLLVVTEVPSPTILKYGVPTMGGNTLNSALPPPYAGTKFFATTGSTGWRTVIRGNHALGAFTGVFHDSHTGKELTVGKNTFRSVLAGVFQYLNDKDFSMGRLLARKNSIDLVVPNTTGYGEPLGLLAAGFKTHYTLSELFVRSNLIHRDPLDGGSLSRAVQFFFVENAIVDANIIAVGRPLEYSSSGDTYFFGNCGPNGSSIASFDGTQYHPDAHVALSEANDDILVAHMLL